MEFLIVALTQTVSLGHRYATCYYVIQGQFINFIILSLIIHNISLSRLFVK